LLFLIFTGGASGDRNDQQFFVRAIDDIPLKKIFGAK
jgi:hypothetical protein